MEEFKLSEAELTGPEGRIAFKRQSAPPPVQTAGSEPAHAAAEEEPEPLPAAPQGTPVRSPMTGIFYTSPSPNAAPFIREGQTVTAGQVVGLIEAMKVFNEITAPTSGTVLNVAAESGQLVQPGDPLLYIG